MNILLFGGTRFLGRHIAEAALGRGHQLTLLHRGLSNPSLFPQAHHIVGDRDGELDGLKGRTFDAVIDTNGFEVFSVRRSARAVGQVPYVFVSTISVYADVERMDEDGPTLTIDDPETATLTTERYGGLKAACERALQEELPGCVLGVRAGKIDGPHDVDERFHYWLTRIARGGEVLAPGTPEAIVQTIDVRDLAAWIVHCVENGARGVMNATGAPMTMRTFLETIRAALGSDARFTWVPDDVLLADGVRPYTEMPYWLPASYSAKAIPTERAAHAGLRLRPFSETVQDTWSWACKGWDLEAPVRAQRRLKLPAGISAEREARLLLR